MIGDGSARVAVGQYQICSELAVGEMYILEVEETYCVNWHQFIVPFASFALCDDGARRVIKCTVDEMLLHAVLHFDDKMSACICGAINVENYLARIFCNADLFVVVELEFCNAELPFEQIVQETDEKVFSNFLSKDVLEAPICERVDVTSHGCLCYMVYIMSMQIYLHSANGTTFDARSVRKNGFLCEL